MGVATSHGSTVIAAYLCERQLVEMTALIYEAAFYAYTGPLY